MALFKRGKIWWYEFVFRGQRIRETTKSTSKTLAEKAERNRRRELEEAINNVKKQRKPLLFSVAAREWVKVMSAGWSDANIAIQNYNLAHLQKYFGKKTYRRTASVSTRPGEKQRRRAIAPSIWKSPPVGRS